MKQVDLGGHGMEAKGSGPLSKREAQTRQQLHLGGLCASMQAPGDPSPDLLVVYIKHAKCMRTR